MRLKLRLDHAHLAHLLKEMMRIRRFELKCVDLHLAKTILGVLAALKPEDAIDANALRGDPMFKMAIDATPLKSVTGTPCAPTSPSTPRFTISPSWRLACSTDRPRGPL